MGNQIKNNLSCERFQRRNLNLLYALEALLISKTVSEAARRANLSQPAMSLCLKKLRLDFDDPLVVYRRGTVSLSALAVSLLPRIRGILESAEEAFSLAVNFDPSTDSREISIVSPGIMEPLFIPRIVREIEHVAPNIRTRVRNQHQRSGSDERFNVEADVCLVPSNYLNPELLQEPFFEEQVSCLVWKDNKKVGDVVTEDMYTQLGHAVCMEAEAPIFKVCQDESFSLLKRNVRVETYSAALLGELIIGTDLMVTTFSRYAQYLASIMPVRVVSSSFPISKVPIYVQYSPHRANEPVILWIRAMLKKIAADMQPWQPK